MHGRAVEREGKLNEEVKRLKALVRQRERELFARRSERGSKGKTKGSAPEKSGGRRRRGQQPGAAGHGRRRHEQLEPRDEIHDLREGEKVCEKCGLPHEALDATEDSEVVEVDVRAYRRVIKRRRYRRRCECAGLPRTLTASGPAKLIPKGSLGVSVWALVLLDKYLFQRPTHRLLSDLRWSHGLHLSAGTIAGGLKRLKRVFEPLYEAIITRNVADTRWHADETRWLVFAEVDGKSGHKWYLWVFVSQSTVVFKLSPSRSSEVPIEHFGRDSHGILNVDRYAAYKVLLRDGRILLAFCWAHVRRDFLAVVTDWGRKHTAWGLGWVEKISVLYRLNEERLAKQGDPAGWEAAQSRLCQAVEAMAQERDRELADPQLARPRRKILESLKNHWSGLVLFVEHPEVPMDNNRAEREQRSPVVGRKNYYGSGSVWSGQLAAMLFSLFQTLLTWKVNPRQWLIAYLEACAQAGGHAPPDATGLLPWNLSEDERRRFQCPTQSDQDTS